MRGAGAGHPARGTGPHRDSAGAAGHPGAATGGLLRRRGMERGRAVRASAGGVSLQGAGAERLRRGGDDAFGRDRQLAGTQRCVPAPRPGTPAGARAAGCTAGSHHVGRGDSGQRELPGGGGARRHPGGHGGRGLRGGEHGGGRVPAGDDLVAHPAGGAGAGAGGGRARRQPLGAVLAGGGPGTDAGALAGGFAAAEGTGGGARRRTTRGVRPGPARLGRGGGVRAPGKGGAGEPAEHRERGSGAVFRRGRGDFADGAGALDAEAIAQVGEEARPLVRDAAELHEALRTLVTLPPEPEWEPWFAELAGERRAAVLDAGRREFWVAAERVDLARAVHPQGVLRPSIAGVRPARGVPETAEGCAAEILRGWFESSGPVRAAELANRLALERGLVDMALAQ